MWWLNLLQICIMNRYWLRLTTVLVVLLVVANVETHGSSTPSLHYMLGPMIESLRLDLQKFFVSQLEEVVCPLRAEASTNKLWLVLMANHLDFIEPPSKRTLHSRFGQSIWPLFPGLALFDSITLVYLYVYPRFHVSW